MKTEVNVKIGNREYNLVCQKGQEAKLQLLANQVSTKFNTIVRNISGPDNLRMAMLLILMQDEINELCQDESSQFTKIKNSDLEKILGSLHGLEKMLNIKYNQN